MAWWFSSRYVPPAFGDAPFVVQTVLTSKKEEKGFRVNMGLFNGKVDTIRIVKLSAVPEKDVTIALPVSLMLTFDGADHPVLLNMKIDNLCLVPVETQAIPVPPKAAGFYVQLTGQLGAKLAVSEVTIGFEAEKKAPPAPAPKPTPVTPPTPPAATSAAPAPAATAEAAKQQAKQ